jgi:hypothetical protein
MKRRSVIVAILVIVCANVGALVGVVRNRSGEPEAAIWLEERELDLLDVAPADGDHALQLRLRYQRSAEDSGPRAAFPEDAVAPRIFDEARLTAIGFDCSVPADSERAASFYRGVLPRPALVVLTLGGPEWETRVAAWQERQRQRIEGQIAGGDLTGEAGERARAEIAAAPQRLSRLMPVDAGRDAAALRAAHPDRTRSIILPGAVSLHFVARSDPGGPSIHGHLIELFPTVLTVPREVGAALETLRVLPGTLPAAVAREWRVAMLDHTPRYEVHVSVGRRLQPWVTGIRTLP